MAKLTWKAEVTVTVHDSWVADGFDLTKERLEEALQSAILPYAYNDTEKKVRAKILEKPAKEKISKLQGE